jgi:phosphatidylinositol-3-phosphatase
MIPFRMALGAVIALCATAGAAAEGLPRYDHIFVIVAENKNYDRIIGSEDAPRLNKLAKEFGLATNFYGEVHPSEANYIAILGGDTFGINDDDAWSCEPFKISADCPFAFYPNYAPHSVSARSLMDQLADAKLTWKGYFEDLPAPGSLALFNPSAENPDPNRPNALYAAKHNGFINFERVRQDAKIAEKIVPFAQLRSDLAANAVPNYAHIILNQCNDMHGLSRAEPMPPDDCLYENAAALIARGDKAIGDIVDEIMAAPVWSGRGNVAIVITWDEDSAKPVGQQGCCGSDPASKANFGGGHIPTIVVTNHGPRRVEDPTPYNHYSLLRTTEDAFGIGEHLGFAAETEKGVRTMTPLFEVTKTSASATATGEKAR